MAGTYATLEAETADLDVLGRVKACSACDECWPRGVPRMAKLYDAYAPMSYAITLA